MTETLYRVVRRFEDEKKKSRVVKRDLTLQEAQQHCASKETSSATAQQSRMRRYTQRNGGWFDSYEEQK